MTIYPLCVSHVTSRICHNGLYSLQYIEHHMHSDFPTHSIPTQQKHADAQGGSVLYSTSA